MVINVVWKYMSTLSYVVFKRVWILVSLQLGHSVYCWEDLSAQLCACLWHCWVDCMSAGWRLTWTMRRVSSTTGGRVIWSSFSNVFTCCSSLSDMIRSSYHALYICYVKTAGWRHGVVVSGVRRMNEVNPRRARLVLGWVTVFGRIYHLRV